MKGRPCTMKLEARGGTDGTEGPVKGFCLYLKSHEKPLRISSRKGDIYSSKRSFNLLDLC